MNIKGNRTYAVVAVILVLALCQKFLSLHVPNEVWIGLFGLALAFLRAGSPAAAAKVVLVALLLLPTLLMTGCGTVSDQQTAEAKEIALAYYSQPKVAELWTIENDGTNTCTFTVSGFTRFTMNTPVPPISIMPKDPGSLAIIGDAIKTAVPYVAGAYLLHGNIGNGSHTVNNNNAAATP